MAAQHLHANASFNARHIAFADISGSNIHVGLVAIPAATVWPHQRNDTSDADSVKGYQTLSNAGKKTNHLDAKSRELIAVAVAVSLRCDGAPSHSINNAKLRTKTIVDAARSASEQGFLAIASERKVGYVMHSDRFGTLLREDYGITFQSNFNPAGLDDAQVFPDVESAQRKPEVIKFFRKTSVNFDELILPRSTACHGETPGKSDGNAQLGTSIFLRRIRSPDCPHKTSNHRPG